MHCQQVFYSEANDVPGWRVVLRKEVRGRRVLPSDGQEAEATLFQMGDDEDFEGLRPEREVGEDQIPVAMTGQDVLLQPVLRPRRHRTGGGTRGVGGRGRAGRQGCGSRGGATRGRRAPQRGHVQDSSEAEDDSHEDERLYPNNVDCTSGGRGGEASTSVAHRRVRRRREVQPEIGSPDESSNSSGRDASTCSSSTSSSSEEASESSEVSSLKF